MSYNAKLNLVFFVVLAAVMTPMYWFTSLQWAGVCVVTGIDNALFLIAARCVEGPR